MCLMALFYESDLEYSCFSLRRAFFFKSCLIQPTKQREVVEMFALNLVEKLLNHQLGRTMVQFYNSCAIYISCKQKFVLMI